MTVDDYIAVDPYDQKPLFSNTKDNEIWTMLLEKAWAKVCGNYANTVGGLEIEALMALTGAPCSMILNSSISLDDLWSYISKSDKRDFVMCCSVGDQPKS